MDRIARGRFSPNPLFERAFGLLLLGFVAFQLVPVLDKLHQLARLEHRYRAEEARLEAHKADLVLALKRAKAGEGVLRVARRDLTMGRPGEVPVVFASGHAARVVALPATPARTTGEGRRD
ncbi:MAG: hypothetical protein VKO21_08785 [Candidatus Sericytochromatia bacterium]|nr:hypothetical protein [Candidatus Sericytochromatia bacterium]